MVITNFCSFSMPDPSWLSALGLGKLDNVQTLAGGKGTEQLGCMSLSS